MRPSGGILAEAPQLPADARVAVDSVGRSPDDPEPIMGSIVSAQGPRRAALVFIFVTIALDMMAIGMIVPVLPKLVEDFLHEDTAAAARIFGVFGAVWALMQFVSMPVMGALSDRFGRRPVILLSNFGLGLDYVLMALAPNLAWLFVGRVISGITAASISTGMAYVADVTPVEKRAVGLRHDRHRLRARLRARAGARRAARRRRSAAAVLGRGGLKSAERPLWLFVLPESLPPDRRRAFEWRRANPVGSLKLLRSRAGPHAARRHLLPGQPGARGAALGLRAVRGLSLRLAGTHASGSVARAHRRELGRSCRARSSGRSSPASGERRTLLTGLAFGVAGFCAYAFAPTGAAFLAAIPLVALWGLAGPSAQGLMTRLVDPRQQGELQGANGAVLGIAAMIGPGLFTLTFATFIARRCATGRCRAHRSSSPRCCSPSPG